MTHSDYEGALEDLQNHKYNAAANQIASDEDMKLKAELERLGELMGNHSKHVSGKLGAVLSNYEDRLIDELAKKASEEGDNH
jgi:hypothetical protein